MENCWNNLKLDWATLIEMLPTLLEKAGQYVTIGMEPDSQPYSISRAKIASRECWIIAEDDDDSYAYLMECSKTTEGYVEYVKEWLKETWCWEWDEPVWVCEKIFGY